MVVTIHVTLSNFSFPYFEYMKKNYEETAINSLQFYCYCLDDQSYEKAKKIAIPFRSSSGGGTMGHCNGVRYALDNIKNTESEIDIIADSDTVMLVNSWDVIAENVLRKVGVFGTSYERIGGRSSGSVPVQTYKNIPNVTWIALSKRYDFSRLQMRPDKQNPLPITNQELSELYQLPVGYSLLKDSGWQIPSYLKENNIPYKALVQEKPTDNAKVLRTGDNSHEEYQFEGEPFIAHQRGSLSRGYRSHELSIKFYDTLDAYFQIVGSKGKILDSLSL